MEEAGLQVSSQNSAASPEKSPLTLEGVQAIRQGRHQDAENIFLSNLEKNPKLPYGEQLEIYSHLIRLAAELRSFEKIAGYIEAVKKIPVKSNAELRGFAMCMFNTAYGWMLSGNTDRVKEYITESLKIAESLGDQDLAFMNKTFLVDLLRVNGQYAEASHEIKALKEYANKSGNSYILSKSLTLEGNILRKQGLFKEAIECFEKARELVGNKNSGDYHYILWALGTCYAALEDLDRAKIYLDMTLNNTEGIEFWRINILSKLTLAELYTVSGDYAKADALYKRIGAKAGSDDSYFGRRMMRGQTLLSIKKGEFEIANELIDRLVVVAVRDQKQSEIMRLRLLKAEVLLRTGEATQHDEARAMLLEAYAFYRDRGSKRHLAVALELLARLDSRSGFPQDALRKAEEGVAITQDSSLERFHVRAELAVAVLQRKLGKTLLPSKIEELTRLINKLNAEPERIVLARFSALSYDDWIRELARLDPHAQRYVNEFFEDFHFVPQQSVDLEIDRNSHYVREKHLGEIPFHNKFTLMRILLLLAETPGKEFSKEQLAKEIWGQDYNPLRHDNNIYININRLRKLIEPNPRESRYVMNGARGYYLNPAVKVNISSKISDVAPRLQMPKKPLGDLAP